MKTFAVYFSPNSYIANNGKVRDIGEVHIQLNDYAFPDKEWTDFGKVIVSWWMEAFRKLLSGEEKKVQCKFMDGNYRFDLEVTNSPGIWHITLIREQGDSEEVENQGEIDAKQSTDSLLSVINEVKELYKKEGKAEYVKNANDFIQRFLLTRQKNLTDAN
jgi:hypothetical protein